MSQMASNEVSNEDKIVAAIDRNTEAVNSLRNSVGAPGVWLFLLWAGLCVVGCPKAKAAPLVSDGDEIASVGTVQVITPHLSWAPALEGSQWISIAQTGWPISTWLPNGTVVSFSEVFSLDSMPSSAMVSFAADDSASLYVNGALVVAEASAVGNGYTVCSDIAPTCTSHTSVDVLPWLVAGENTLRFDVAQRGGWSYGLNYAGSMTWLDESPLPTPEPGTGVIVLAYLGVGRACQLCFKRKATKQVGNGDGFQVFCDRCLNKARRLIAPIADTKAIARKALEE